MFDIEKCLKYFIKIKKLNAEREKQFLGYISTINNNISDVFKFISFAIVNEMIDWNPNKNDTIYPKLLNKIYISISDVAGDTLEVYKSGITSDDETFNYLENNGELDYVSYYYQIDWNYNLICDGRMLVDGETRFIRTFEDSGLLRLSDEYDSYKIRNYKNINEAINIDSYSEFICDNLSFFEKYITDDEMAEIDGLNGSIKNYTKVEIVEMMQSMIW